jgi:hypothetical protein
VTAIALAPHGPKPASEATDPGPSAGAVSAQLVELMGGLKDTIDAIVLKDPTSSTNGSRQFAKLPDHLQKMYLRLGHVQGTPLGTSLCDQGKNFMAQTTMASAASLLKTGLRQLYGLNAVVQPGSVQALRSAQLLWEDPSLPGNHSIFQYYSHISADDDNSLMDLAWHLTSTKGKGVKGSDIRRALKLKPRAPTIAFDASRQIMTFASAHVHFWQGMPHLRQPKISR